MGAIETAVGHPDVVEFMKITENARSLGELESVVQRDLGRTGLMVFMKLDLGKILRGRPDSTLRKSCAF